MMARDLRRCNLIAAWSGHRSEASVRGWHHEKNGHIKAMRSSVVNVWSRRHPVARPTRRLVHLALHLWVFILRKVVRMWASCLVPVAEDLQSMHRHPLLAANAIAGSNPLTLAKLALHSNIRARTKSRPNWITIPKTNESVQDAIKRVCVLSKEKGLLGG